MIPALSPSRLLASLALCAVVGCSPAGSEVQCQLDRDCASGVCLSDGTCAPVSGTGGTGGSGGTSDQDASTDDADDSGGTGGPTPGLDAGADATDDGAGGGTCQPDHDNVITRDEIPLQAGLHATYKIASGVQWDTTGETQPNGARAWDLSGDFSGDHLSLVETQALAGLWFAPDFPTATYASRLSDSETLLGIFELSGDKLLLLGVASPDDGLTRTKLTYDPPVVVLQFPFEQGSTWETTSTVSGLASGVAAYYTEKYANQVDAYGSMKTPFGTFDVLRIRVVLTRTVGVMPTTVRQYLFATECFGTVATVASTDNEQQIEFTQIKELKRLSP